MKKLLTILFLSTVFINPSGAGTWIDIPMFSKHVGGEDYWITEQGEQKDLNEFNHGLGITHELTEHYDIRAGFFKNSFEKTSVHIGVGLHTNSAKPLSVGVRSGFVSGYANTPLDTGNEMIGYVMPTLSFSGQRARFEIGYVPLGFNSDVSNHIFTLTFSIKL